MTSTDAPAHLLSLKVMRLSRPALSSAWQPFYSSSPSFSAHSTESIVSLQGKTPLPGHPKTLRDITSATELLTLPSSFGSIQLGETFSSCLCVNNESKAEVETVSVKVEMQTVTSKVVLAEFGGSGPEGRLSAGDTLENVVHHEIKELGQHVLACTVSYRFPSNLRGTPASERAGEPSIQTFRKFYKFAVTNPLSVKTKVHPSKSPSALMSTAERDKLFLEVHIQNLTTEPIWFEHMSFEPVENWNSKDLNLIDGDKTEQEVSLYSGSTALMQPQDMRQYIYVLTPKSVSLEPVVHAPGTIIPLGRLDISWRSSFGEPGRLLTSMLSRRIPLVTVPQAPVSALPPHLKKTVTLPPQPPSRPTSPGPSQRPSSPFRSRQSSFSTGGRPQSPVTLSSPIPLPHPLPTTHNIETHLLVRRIPRESLVVGEPFTISFTLILSCALPPERRGQRLKLSLIVQHLSPPKHVPAPPDPPSTNPLPFEVYSPRNQSTSPGFSTPSPTYTTFNYGLAHQKLLIASQSQSHITTSSLDVDGEGHATPRSHVADHKSFSLSLPPPYFTDEAQYQKISGKLLGFPPIELHEQAQAASGSGSGSGTGVVAGPGSNSDSSDDEDGKTKTSPSRLYATHDFELSFVASQKGFATIGGLRLLLADDRYVKDDSGNEGEDEMHMHVKRSEAHTLKEWDVVGEVFLS
ncbi:hypothetical protein D9758_001739 [Tetrapyrgos nigripes]|uniref:DUF974-domain-containing protein n=1 Tax=Tetrapyrgos nigripes TaxID=182062 RepID=A0A8H5GY86_9AGAR|nr:hypothetical protein D9758_001739 [Tetrapyrgos nigripes]